MPCRAFEVSGSKYHAWLSRLRPARRDFERSRECAVAWAAEREQRHAVGPRCIASGLLRAVFRRARARLRSREFVRQRRLPRCSRLSWPRGAVAEDFVGTLKAKHGLSVGERTRAGSTKKPRAWRWSWKASTSTGESESGFRIIAVAFSAWPLVLQNQWPHDPEKIRPVHGPMSLQAATSGVTLRRARHIATASASK
jgi:hypothetical protein